MDTKEMHRKQIEIDVAYAKKQVKDIDEGKLSHFEPSFVRSIRRIMLSGINNPNLITGVCSDPGIICSMCRHGITNSKKCYLGGWDKCEGVKFNEAQPNS